MCLYVEKRVSIFVVLVEETKADGWGGGRRMRIAGGRGACGEKRANEGLYSMGEGGS
jgi:hypothetical protein